MLLLDTLTFLIGLPEPPNWIPLFAIPCLIIGFIAALAEMLIEGECTCAMCMAIRQERKQK